MHNRRNNALVSASKILLFLNKRSLTAEHYARGRDGCGMGVSYITLRWPRKIILKSLNIMA